ncbi:MAG: HD domain-containing protein [Fusobacteriaceae bacterium]
MYSNNQKAREFIENLMEHPMVKELNEIDDQGVKVSAHTYDVLRTCQHEIEKNFKNLEFASKKLDFFSIIIGVIIHDLSKGSIRKDGDKTSHSQMMIKNPEYISKESEKILEEIEQKSCVKLKKNYIRNIIHIVISHHGKWGKIQPGSREAHLVHKADEYSAKYHRIIPIGADKILKCISEGVPLEDVHTVLGCTPGIIKDRLKRSKDILGIKNLKQLQSYYKKNKKIPLGDEFFELRVKETAKLVKLVEKKGVKRLIFENPLLDYLEDNRIFEEIQF